MIAPREITAEASSRTRNCAARGNSKAPGTSLTIIFFSSTP